MRYKILIQQEAELDLQAAFDWYLEIAVAVR